MPSQNTVARTELTEIDRKAIEICTRVSQLLQTLIPRDRTDAFIKDYGRTHYSRDAGQGRAAGKLQRDSLCTRGKQSKAPFSNRNLRWHPLVIAKKCPPDFTEMNIAVDNERKILIFVPSDDPSKKYFPEEVHKLPKAYCVSENAWLPFIGDLKDWSMDDWVKNWCAIPAVEYCPWKFAVETYAILGIAIAVGLFDVDLKNAYEQVKTSLENEFALSRHYPSLSQEIVQCPVCRTHIGAYPAGLTRRIRPEIWKPVWEKVKRAEGEDESIQLTHIDPLIETKINHHASNVRYGHRWCNVAMTDHSVDQTIEWMKCVIKRHS